MKDRRSLILYFFVVCALALSGGFFKGYAYHRKMIQKQRQEIKTLKEEQALLNEQQQKIVHELNHTRHIRKLYALHEKEKTTLLQNFQARYSQMAAEAMGLHALLSKAILEGETQNLRLKDVRQASFEIHDILKNLVKGFPAQAQEKNLNLLETIERTKDWFLGEIIEKNIEVQTGKLRSIDWWGDKEIIEAVLHNILYMVMERLMEKGILKISVEEQRPICSIIFQDNGYDWEVRTKKITNANKPMNLLTLEKEKLSEFVSSLGWHISFRKTEEFNITELRLFSHTQEKTLCQNVVSLFR